MSGINVLSLFDGISVGRHVLKALGVQVGKYYACEIDKYAMKVSDDNHDDVIRLGDVRDVDFTQLPKIDLILAGSPCQGFSFAGKQLNFSDARSSLYFEFERALGETGCKNFLLENVNMKKEYKDIIDERLGVSGVKINSNLFTAQNRSRYYWISWEVDLLDLPPISKSPSLQTLLPECVGVYTIPRGWNKGGVRIVEKSPCLTTSSWQHNFFWVDSFGVKHKFTSAIAEELQGLPQGYTKSVSENQAFKCLGNGWTAPVIEYLIRKGVKEIIE